jgi:hypothetical protein
LEVFDKVVLVVDRLVKIVLEVFDKDATMLFEVFDKVVLVVDRLVKIVLDVLLSPVNNKFDELKALLLVWTAVLLENTPRFVKLVIVPPVMVDALILPFTSNKEFGLLVPIPTFELNHAKAITLRLLHRVVFEPTIRLLDTYALPEISNVY